MIDRVYLVETLFLGYIWTVFCVLLLLLRISIPFAPFLPVLVVFFRSEFRFVGNYKRFYFGKG